MQKNNPKKEMQKKTIQRKQGENNTKKQYKKDIQKAMQKNIQKAMQKIQKTSHSPSPTLHAGVDLVNGMHFCLFEALKLNTESRDRSLFKIRVKCGFKRKQQKLQNFTFWVYRSVRTRVFLCGPFDNI